LLPVMTLASELIAVREHRSAGEHRRLRLQRSPPIDAMRIGIVACGYADGYPRHAPTGTPGP
jgi:alanine racemase